MNRRAPILLATGGTGGHVFPAEALGRALAGRGQTVAVITDRRGLDFHRARSDAPAFAVRAATPSGGGLAGRVRGAAELALGTLQARALLKRLRPAAVVGFGGYASVPAVFAASLLGLPTAIHEQNAVLGRANRFLAGRVDRIALSFPGTLGLGAEDADKTVLTGNPVRAEIAQRAATPYADLVPDGPLRLLITGGSQGATVFADIVPAAVARLPAPLRARLVVTQQCRPEDLARVRAAYNRIGVAAETAAFFSDLPARLAAAHLVIARSGASTVSELAAIGRPALLVPYIHAIDDHQTANAHALDDAGGAWLMPQPAFTPEALAARLESFLALPETLVRAAACAKAAWPGDAAEKLADLVMILAAPDKIYGRGTDPAPCPKERPA